jgi:hypothetical protein
MATAERLLFDGSDLLVPEARRLARRDDPSTSAQAAAELIETGAIGRQRAAVLDALRQCREPVTSAELATMMRGDRYTPSRRLPELLRLGLVERTAPRVCRVGGRLACTWHITSETQRT